MRYTQYRGLAQITNWVKLKFVAMNLKKLAKWLWKERFISLFIFLFWPLYDRNPAYVSSMSRVFRQTVGSCAAKAF